ncbi:uncharacterized protein [Branchiostoma lanceolatum]|uniref:uncharacterized protein n=1 Tax=Branchiostoma lanceolatum TaxID=7740 RepID=UPI003454B8FA
MGMCGSKRPCCACVLDPWKRLRARRKIDVGVNMKTPERPPRTVDRVLFVAPGLLPEPKEVNLLAEPESAEPDLLAESSDQKIISQQATEEPDQEETKSDSSDSEDSTGPSCKGEAPAEKPRPSRSMRLIFVQEAPSDCTVRTVGRKGTV